MPSPPLLSAFPPAWTWLVDESIPTWVKRQYSPKDTWKNKPFSPEDGRFFFKGIEDLSDLFGEDRRGSLPDYFAHPKYRSSYLLYFLPLQAAKFLTILKSHSAALEAAVEHGTRNGVLRVLDLGAGPATASLALALKILEKPIDVPVEFHLVDSQKAILDDGKGLLESFAGSFPKLRGKISVHTHVCDWKKFRTDHSEFSLTIVGHLLNEAATPQLKSLAPIFERASGGGVLFVEPAARRPSQMLSQLRDQILGELVEKDAHSIWGPCPHAEGCPLSDGRDWCHFSVRTEIPGKWFREFSKGLGSERQWLKFSYVWFASREWRAKPQLQAQGKNMRLLISDPIRKPGAMKATVLLCEPETPGRMEVPGNSRLHRGDWVRLNSKVQSKVSSDRRPR